jgi:hypothetical protein
VDGFLEWYIDGAMKVEGILVDLFGGLVKDSWWN